MDAPRRPLWDPFVGLPALRPWIWIALAAVAVATQGASFLASLRPPADEGNDFFQEWAAARNWLDGHPIYEPFSATVARYMGHDQADVPIFYNAHPPTTVWFALPVAGLSYPDAGLVWNLAMLAVLVAGVVLVCRELDIRLAWWGWAPLVVVVLLYNPLRQHFGLGQINLLMMLGIVLAWRAERHGRDVWAGVWIGLAAGVKLLPLFLLVIAALRGRWRIVLGGAAAFAAWCGLTWLLVGSGPFLDYGRVVVPTLNASARSLWLNCSLPSLWAKLFDPNPADRIVPLLDAPALAAALRWASTLGLVAALVLVLRRKPVRTTPYDLGLTLTTMLLVSPVCYDTYVVILLPALFLAWRELPPDGGPKALWLLSALGCFAVEAGTLFSVIPGGVTGTAEPWHAATVLAVRTYGLILLWVGFFALSAGARIATNEHHRTTTP